MVSVHVACTEDEAARVRPDALAAYGAARDGGGRYLSDVLAPIVRGRTEADAAVIAAVAQAMMKYDRLLSFAAPSAAPSSRFDALFALAGGRAPVVEEKLSLIADRVERLAVTFSFPDWLVARLNDELGPDPVELALERMNEVPPRAARVNTLRATREDVLRALARAGVEARPGVCAAQAIVIDGRRSPFRTSAFAAGQFEMQDEASQLVAELVAPPPRSFVVDACAGAGGKTLALAALLGGKGQLLALDASERKLDELRRRARRAGVSNVRAVCVDWLAAEPPVSEWIGKAARVLVDAPCSGLGAMRRNPEARWHLQAAAIDRLVEMQASLMREASRLVAPGGRLVYATCSFLPSEGAAVFERFLAGAPSFSPVSAREVLGREKTADVATPDGRYLTTWRFGLDRVRGAGPAPFDGFFAAVARRTERGP